MTNDRAEGVRRTIDLLGINPVEEKNLSFKPNFNSGDPAPGSTHPDILQTEVMDRKLGQHNVDQGKEIGK